VTTLEDAPERLQFERLGENEQVRRSRAVLALMRQRRSVRHFSSEPGALELIESAARARGDGALGCQSTAVEIRRRLRPGRQGGHPGSGRTRRGAALPRAGERGILRGDRTDRHRGVKPHLTQAPYLIAVFEQAWSVDAAGDKRKHYYVRESVGIAVGFLIAALHNAGLATHAPSPMGFLREILARPDGERPFLLIPVGYPAENAVVPALAKKRFADVVEFV
jgi:iodotyrosine deiodinase